MAWELAMKLILSAFVLGLGLAAAVPAAEARVCAHRTHCGVHQRIAHLHHHHNWRYGENGAIGGAPPPYGNYYPPVPASVFDLPPDSAPVNQLQWLMNSVGDVPFADHPRYR
jgi:hypothetical protein